MAAIGAGFVAVPFIRSWQPSARTRAAGAPVEVSIAKLEPGQMIRVKWRQKPVFILRRTQQMLNFLERDEHRSLLRDPDASVRSQQPKYIRGPFRSERPDVFVCVGLCTHLGCVPIFRPDMQPEDLGVDWHGGWFCPCHGSKFDLAGRVYKGVPAPTNLVVPPYRFVTAARIEIGKDPA